MEYILIFISAVFVNNIVLSQFLGICPFLGVSKKVDTALGMAGAVAFVLTLATIITYMVQVYLHKSIWLRIFTNHCFYFNYSFFGTVGRNNS
jgi:electron transport complex protein RnfA